MSMNIKEMRIELKCGWWLKSNNNHNHNDIGKVGGSKKQLEGIVQEHALGKCYPLCHIFKL